MHRALICQVDPGISSQLKAEMRSHGWSIDACDGLLEMLRLIENNDYRLVILNASRQNAEISTRLGAIKALDKNPKVLLNLPESDSVMSFLLTLEYPVIKGDLTSEKLLMAAQESF